MESYERLEFLGDSVLELAITKALFERHPGSPEGDLTVLRAQIVSRESCAVVARELDLGGEMVTLAERGSAEDAKRLGGNRNVLAALLEAALGALLLEHGFERIEPAVVRAFEGRFEEALRRPLDPKTELQEVLAQRGEKVRYETIGAEGPVHERTFTVAAVVEAERRGVGRGRTKKQAEQAAAKEALGQLDPSQ